MDEHLSGDLPGTWDPEPESDAERRAQDRVFEAAHTASTATGRKKAEAVRTLKAAKAQHTWLAKARAERNKQGAATAKATGLVSTEDARALSVARMEWGDEIRRWQLAEGELRRLLAFLEGERPPRGDRVAAALERLSTREFWPVDELPAWIDLEVLRCLDADGAVEARGTWILEAMKRAVEASDKSRYLIAKESGVSAGQLSRLVRGERGLSVETVERLADYLGLRITIGPKGKTRKAR